jgi:TolB-like protein/Tfp pilus assembly protein PilF
MPMRRAAGLYRFGPYEFDAASGDLFRQGRKRRLQNQVARILALFLAHPGKVFARDELRAELWPADTFVDFDRGLNKAVNGLRTILRDNPRKPRFLETLPRRGYRFIAPVERGMAGSGEAPPEAGAGRIGSLAVLPLANHSGDPEQEYFSDGMTEELITAVSRIESLRVISRTSAMRYKNSGKSLPEIARELGVDAVIEGSVGLSAGKVRITAQLIRAADDRHLWSARYERELADVLRLQAEIAEGIAGSVGELIGEGRRAASPSPVHPQAYESYLKGNFFRDRMTPAALERSIGLFERAIALDGGFAPAYAGLSQAFFFLGVFGMRPPRELFPKAKEAAARAVELDETLAPAHTALAAIYILYDWDWAKAEAGCRRAMELNPGEPVARVHLADFMSIRGRHDEAIAEFRRALALDPISRVYLGHFGLILYRARRYEEAIEQCRKALEVDPGYANAMWFQALSLEKTGRIAESAAALRKAVEASGGGLHYRALLARAHGLWGERQKAAAILAEIEVRARKAYVSPFDIAIVHLGLRDHDAAFALLEESYRQRVFRLIELTTPLFDEISGDPRWAALVRRMGLPVSPGGG